MAMTTLVKQMTSDGTNFTTFTTTVYGFAPREQISLPVLRDKTLAYVNTARCALGLPTLKDLPKGHIGNYRNCVIARAFPHRVAVGNHVVFNNEKTAKIVAETWATKYRAGTRFDEEPAPEDAWHVKLPDAMASFISCFDNGAYPDLIADGLVAPL